MIPSIPIIVGLVHSFDSIAPLQSQSEIQEWMMTPDASFFITMTKVSIALMLIFYGMAGFHPKKQALHDLIVRTYVVKRPDTGPVDI
jgi:hypothetical protein